MALRGLCVDNFDSIATFLFCHPREGRNPVISLRHCEEFTMWQSRRNNSISLMDGGSTKCGIDVFDWITTSVPKGLPRGDDRRDWIAASVK